ncbi:MAG: hypothetical protein ACRESE_04345 [Gammaproteobacteria bacterium]
MTDVLQEHAECLGTHGTIASFVIEAQFLTAPYNLKRRCGK